MTRHGVFGAIIFAGCLAAPAAWAQGPVQAGYEGWFARGELGANLFAGGDGYWWGPGGPPADPRITFSLNNPAGVQGAAGLGYDWGNGVRVDAALGVVVDGPVHGAFKSASDGSAAAGHATDIEMSASAVSLMGNLYVEPARLMGNDSSVQPFVTGGLGGAMVTTGEWSRTNPASAQTVRHWEGATSTNFAWSVGAGVSFDLADLLGHKGRLDLTYRYTDFGQATGGSAPVNPPPSGSPTEPFNYRLATHAITVGLRIPIGE